MTRTAYDLTPDELAALTNARFILANRERFYALLSDLNLEELCQRLDDDCDLGRWLRGLILDWRTEIEDSNG